MDNTLEERAVERNTREFTKDPVETSSIKNDTCSNHHHHHLPTDTVIQIEDDHEGADKDERQPEPCFRKLKNFFKRWYVVIGLLVGVIVVSSVTPMLVAYGRNAFTPLKCFSCTALNSGHTLLPCFQDQLKNRQDYSVQTCELTDLYCGYRYAEEYENGTIMRFHAQRGCQKTERETIYFPGYSPFAFYGESNVVKIVNPLNNTMSYKIWEQVCQYSYCNRYKDFKRRSTNREWLKHALQRQE